MRRYLIIAAIVIVLLGGAVGAYFWLFSGGASIAVSPSGSTSLPSSSSTPASDVNTSPVVATSSQAAAQVSARLVEIAPGPVAAGEAVVDVSATASSSADVMANYVDRESGNVYSYSVASGKSTRTSNRTVPGIQRALWNPAGTTAFITYLSGSDSATINTYALPANGTGGFFLPQNLSGLAISSSSIYALASNADGSSVTRYAPDGSKPSGVLSTPLSSLRIAPTASGFVAFTKPTETLPGYAYLVSGGALTRVVGPASGLVALPSPDGKWLLVSAASSGVLHLSLVNTATGALTALPVATIADKCVWASDSQSAYCGVPVSPSANYAYPDDWYQGAVSFNDRIWKIDVSARYAQLVLDFATDAKRPLDAVALSIDPKTSFLVFVNKYDGSLWGYSL